MSSIPTPSVGSLPVLATIHAQSFQARAVSTSVAVVQLTNAAFCAQAFLTREELASLGETLCKLAETLEDTPDTPATLVTPQGAGSLFVPGRD